MKESFVTAAFLFTRSGYPLAVGNLADITIYDHAESRLLPVYQHEGRHYLVGKPGNEYQISVRDHLGLDVLTVISVDGVNAVSGETANGSQTGCVLSSYVTYSIKGWRESLQRTAAFFFTEPGNSYAARTGRPDDVGVIRDVPRHAKPNPFPRQLVPDPR